MSTEQPSQGRSLATDADRQRLAAQSGQWREIGISAVAAAAKQASQPAPAPAATGKVVTLRDIDHLAA